MSIALVALVLALAWFVLAFGVRIALQVRRHGDTGIRRKLAPGSLAFWAGLLFLVSILLVGVAPALDLAGIAEPIDALAVRPVQVGGLALAVAGVVATFVAQLAMGASWRIGVDEAERTDLVVHGPFRFVRNPIFSTMFVTTVGLVAAVPSAPTIAGVVLLAVTLELQVRGVEEPHLLAVHGDAYRRYTAEVGRFVPRCP